MDPLRQATLTTNAQAPGYATQYTSNYENNYQTVYSSAYPTQATADPNAVDYGGRYLNTSDFYRPLSRLSTGEPTALQPPPPVSRPPSPGFNLGPPPFGQTQFGQPIHQPLHQPLRPGTLPPLNASAGKPDEPPTDRGLAYVVSSPVGKPKRGRRLAARLCGHFVSLLVLLMMCALFVILIRSFQSGVGTGFHRHGRFMYPIG